MKELLNIEIIAWTSSIGKYHLSLQLSRDMLENDSKLIRDYIDQFITRCPNENLDKEIKSYIEQLKEKGDSIGGTITCVCKNVPLV